MKKWNMIVDVTKCHNCYNCFVATKDEYVDNAFAGYSAPQPLHGHSWVDIETSERGQWPVVEANFRPVMCNHCDDAPCISAAENGAVKKRDDGIVIIDPEKSKGQKQIVDACPYGAVYWNDDLDIPQAWPFDAHLLDNGWGKTKLESVCPTDVFQSVKVSDSEMQAMASEQNLETLEPRNGARPRVYYRNNHLFESCFVAGTVVGRDANGMESCVEGATCTVLKDGNALGSATSDAFGEFKIDKLPPGTGSISVTVEPADGPQVTIDADLQESLYLGCVDITADG